MKQKIISSLIFSLGIITSSAPSFWLARYFLADKNMNDVSVGMNVAVFVIGAVALSVIPSIGYGIGLLTFKTKPRRQMHSFIMGFVFGVVAVAIGSQMVEEPQPDEIWFHRIIFFMGGFCSAGLTNIFNRTIGEDD